MGALIGQKLPGLPESLPYGALRIVKVAEDEGLGGTPLNAGRLFPYVHAVRAKGALGSLSSHLDPERRRILLVGHAVSGKIFLLRVQPRHAVRAGINAGSGAHALLLIDQDDPVGTF